MGKINLNRKETAKAELENYLQDVHGIDTRHCFHCLNPKHEDKHPSMALDRKNHRCVCFACGARYDIFDVVGLDYQITNTAQKFRKVYQILELDGGEV